MIATERTSCAECGEPLTVEGLGGDEPQHVFCDLCGMAEHPADMPPGWNGETGCHTSCEWIESVTRYKREALAELAQWIDRLELRHAAALSDALAEHLAEVEAAMRAAFVARGV